MYDIIRTQFENLLFVIRHPDVWSDALSSLILILMILTLWQSGWRGYRPAKHLFEWIRRYPMLAAVYGMFTLISWGVIGTEYGMKTALISDDGLVQFLCGFALIAIFLRLSFQIVVLDRSRERWFWTLGTCLEVERAIYGGDSEVWFTESGLESTETGGGGTNANEGLPNKTQSSMTVAELKRLLKPEVAAQPGGQEVMKILDSDRFRLAMAPLILDFYATILVVFLGLIPLIFGLQPLLGEAGGAIRSNEFLKLARSAFELISQRGSWFFGILAGVLMAKSLVWASTNSFQKYVSDMIGQAKSRVSGPDRRLEELEEEWPRWPYLIDKLREALNNAGAHARDVSRAGASPWRNLRFLGSAAAMTLLILANLYETSNQQLADGAADTARGPMVNALYDVGRVLGIVLFAAVPLCISIAIVGYLAVAFVEIVRRSFSLVVGRKSYLIRFSGLVVVLLIVLAFGGMLAGARSLIGNRFGTLAYPLLAVIASIVIQRLSMQKIPFHRINGRLRPLTAFWVVTLVMVPLLASSWSRVVSLEPEWASTLVGFAKYLFALKVGSWMVRRTTALFDPLISYPVSAIWGFLAFAGLYVELPEPTQAQVPAAFTIIYFAGVLASILTCVLHSDSSRDPRRIVFAVIVTLLMLGQGWTTSPNQFKIRFPGLDGLDSQARPPQADVDAPDVVNYYDKPVRLNSEAYFRITNLSVIKLHLQEDTARKNKQRSIRPSNRMASGMIPPVGPQSGTATIDPETSGVQFERDGSLIFRYFDEQNFEGDIRPGSNYLRLRGGDPLELIRLDTRFDLSRDETPNEIVIELKPGGLEFDFPDSATLERIYAAAESLTIKLTDRLEMDSGIRATLIASRSNDDLKWKAQFGEDEFDANLTFEKGKIRIGGQFARKVFEKIAKFEERKIEETEWIPVGTRQIESALVTATWRAKVKEVKRRKMPGKKTANGQPADRTEIEVLWPLEKGGKEGQSITWDANRIASFLHLTYLVAGSRDVSEKEKRAKLLESIVSGETGNPPRDVREAIRKSLALEDFGDGEIEPGDCFSFEFMGWESPVKIADLVCFGPNPVSGEWAPVLQPFLLSDQAMWDAIRQAPVATIKGFDDSPPKSQDAAANSQNRKLTDSEIAEKFLAALRSFEVSNWKGNGDSNTADRKRFVLRQSRQSGVFAFDARPGNASNDADGTRIAFVYGSHRILKHDRLVLRWRDASSAAERKTATYEVDEVLEIQDAESKDGRPHPPGKARKVRLQPIDNRNRTEKNETGGSELFQDELPRSASKERLAGTWTRLDSLDNYEVLKAWKEANSRENRTRPKLVIVTVSGGGIRSEVWTATVLETLDVNLGSEFSKSIRIITGASGGMVAASDFVGNVSRTGLKWNRDHLPIPKPASGSDGRDRDGYLTLNQLDSVIGQMIYSDIPGALNPFPRKVDRGRTLEKSWARIARAGNPGGPSPFERTIRELAAGEAAGWRPSIVFTPMMVEDGRRLLISNLDLSFVTRNVSALLMEENRRKIKHAAYENVASDRLINRADDLLSLSSIEFFRVFPDAWQFTLATATRMSASFPWVAPAVSIPTIPPRRIVDAGYYDNFGVNLAALWLAEMREWLKKNTGGVLLVQIRDHESQSRRTDIDFDLDTGKNSSKVRATFDKMTNSVFERNVGHVLYPVLTPVSGAATARSWTMSFRNDEQVELLDELFNDKDTEEKAFFRTVVFECPVEASLSWNLSRDEIVNITSGFGAKDTVLNDVDFELSDEEAKEPDAEKRENLNKRRMLKAIGIGEKRLAALREEQVKELYENIFGNRKRIQLLNNWWNR